MEGGGWEGQNFQLLKEVQPLEEEEDVITDTLIYNFIPSTSLLY